MPNLPKAGQLRASHSPLVPAKRGACIVLASIAVAVLPTVAWAQGSPPQDLVRAAVSNELQDDAHQHLFSWKVRKLHPSHGTQVTHVVNTPTGVVSRVILIDDKPLNSEQQAAEERRLRRATEPAQMERKLRDDQEDDERTREMLEAIPKAFDFTYVDTVTAENGHQIVTLKFKPRAGYNPPTRELKVFTGMEGDLVVDETANRLAKVDGTLVKDVEFGWGIFGRLYKGGRFLIEKTEVTPMHWDTSRELLHFDGKIMMFKSLHIDEDEISWDYQPVPPMSVEQALDFLSRDEQHPQNASADPSSELSRGAQSDSRSAPGVVHSRAPAYRSRQSFHGERQ